MGRLDWNGLFATVVTQPAPLKSTGRLLHPSLDRFVTVREPARAQTFPDNFRFDLVDKTALLQVTHMLNKYFRVSAPLQTNCFTANHELTVQSSTWHKSLSGAYQNVCRLMCPKCLQIGNAVPQLIAEEIGMAVLPTLRPKKDFWYGKG